MSATLPPISGCPPRVVIVGAGFAGMGAVKALHRFAVDVTLLDQNDHHVFSPFLYQVATALLEPSEVALPVRSLRRRLHNVTLLRQGHRQPPAHQTGRHRPWADPV